MEPSQTLTPELTKRIDLYIEKNHRYPKNVTVANALKISKEDADNLLSQHRQQNGKRDRKGPAKVMTEMPVEPTEVKPNKPSFLDWAKSAADWLVDTGTILTAVIIDLVLSAICLWIMGPSQLEKVAFVALAFILVLFGLRALVRGHIVIYVLCVSMSWFLDTSFVMVGIDYQTNLTADDRELVRLEAAEKQAADYLAELQSKQVETGTGYKAQIEAQQRVADAATAKASEYRRQVAGRPKQAPEIKAYDIFYAIPKAGLSGSVAVWIALVFFSVLFGILQATMYTTVVPEKKS